MKKIIFTVTPIVLFAILFCWIYTSQQTDNALLSAEKPMDTDPDSASFILGEIKNSRYLSGENRALYTLLKTQSPFIPPVASDSPICIAGNYYKEIKGSIESSEDDAEIINLQKKYDYSLIQNENNRLKIEKQRRNNSILVLTILVIVISITGYLFTQKERHKRESELREKEEEVKRYLYQKTEQENNLSLQEQQLRVFRLHEKELQEEIGIIRKKLHEQMLKEQELKQTIYRSNVVVKKLLSINEFHAGHLLKPQEKIRLTTEEENELFDTLNLCFDNFTERLRAQFLKLQNLAFKSEERTEMYTGHRLLFHHRIHLLLRL